MSRAQVDAEFFALVAANYQQREVTTNPWFALAELAGERSLS